jgi:hypothetical protein
MHCQISKFQIDTIDVDRSSWSGSEATTGPQGPVGQLGAGTYHIAAEVR